MPAIAKINGIKRLRTLPSEVNVKPTGYWTCTGVPLVPGNVSDCANVLILSETRYTEYVNANDFKQEYRKYDQKQSGNGGAHQLFPTV